MKLTKKLIAVGLTLSMATSLVAGSVANAEDTVSYKYKDDYTYGYIDKKVAVYKDGVKQDVDPKVYSAETDDPFTPEEQQAWDTKNLELTPGLTYTTAKGKVHPITSMLTNWNLCADPTAIDNSDVDGKLYVYGTTEGVDYTNGEMAHNGYNNHSLTIMSTSDMVNWTDEGFMDNQNLTNLKEDEDGKVKCGWAQKAWAPSGLKIDGDGDGEDEFYLFYTNGGAVGYVQGDSPTGPWKDDLGVELFNRSTPGCMDVIWCFDPAVLVDDKGDAYVYFGGGVGTDKAHPKTARVAKIAFEEGTGKVLIDGTPQEMDPYYLFEDSEINQFHGKYYYSYCTNFDVPGNNKFTGSGQIACYVSTDPMNITFDPDTQESTDDLKYLGTILKNPSSIYGKSYNNHHHMLSFKDHEYILYHSTALENMLYHTTQDYRCLHVDEIEVDKETDQIKIEPTYEGASQIENFKPYQKINATTTSYSAGVKSFKSDNAGSMVLDKIDTGDWTKISGVDFGENGATKFAAEIASTTENGAVEVFIDDPTVATNKVASVNVKNTGEETYEVVETAIAESITGVHDVYFVFRGTGYRVASWTFTEKEAPAPTTTPTPETPAASATPAPGTPAPTVTPTPTVTPSEDKVSVSKPAIKSVKNVKGKKAKVTLKKKIKGANGYEIRYSLKKTMKSAKKATIKKANTLKVTISKLKKSKTYYFQARAYKTVNGKKYYSSWSGKKKVKIKK